MQMEPGGILVANTDKYGVFRGRDWSREAQGLGRLHVAFVWMEGRAGCGNVKKYREQRSWQGLAHRGENAHGLQSKNQTSRLARAGSLQERCAAWIM